MSHLTRLLGAVALGLPFVAHAGPSDYVYEPAGNVDSWKVVGDVPLVVLVVVTGAVEYLDARGNVTRRYTAQTLRDLYDEFCRSRGIGIRDLVE